MIKEVLYILIVILGFPIGLLLKKLCKDEINLWGKRFLVMSIIALILIIILLFISFQYKLPSIIALLFIIITSLTIKFFNRKTNF